MTDPAATPRIGIPEQALTWHQAGTGAVLATVIQTWGSAPRRAGSQMVVSGAGQIEGSVSGGCVEGAVVVEALEALEEGALRLLEFGVTDEDAFSVGLACGGTIRILLEPVGSDLPEALLQELVDARASRQPVLYHLDPDTKVRWLERDSRAPALRLDRSGIDAETGRITIAHNPPLRLIVVGAVHIAQMLVTMARTAGYDPVVVDPREAFASPERFPEVELVKDWPDEALEALAPDARTAVVLLTHDPKLDDPALRIALHSECFYIGALGSTRTHAKRLDRLRAEGQPVEALARIHGPVGLDIGAANPAEIAVAILAEMTEVLRKAPAETGA